MEKAWGVNWSVGHVHFAMFNGSAKDGTWTPLPLIHPTAPATPYYVIPIADALWKRGELLIVTWGTVNLDADPDPTRAVRARMEPLDILAGKYDAYFHQQAKTLIAWKHPIVFALNAEFNLQGSPWYMEPNDFVAVWRYIVSLFRSDGASNVSWAWVANQLAKPGNSSTTAEDKLAAYYPGDQYVDFTGCDVYNWSTANSPTGTWSSFTDVMTNAGYGNTYGTIARIAPTKQMIIGEVGCHNTPGDQGAWIADMLAILPTSFPLVAMVSYYGIDDPNSGKWSLSTTASTSAWANGVLRGPYAVGGTFPMPPDMQTLKPLFVSPSWGRDLADDLAACRAAGTALSQAYDAAQQSVTLLEGKVNSQQAEYERLRIERDVVLAERDQRDMKLANLRHAAQILTDFASESSVNQNKPDAA